MNKNKKIYALIPFWNQPSTGNLLKRIEILIGSALCAIETEPLPGTNPAAAGWQWRPKCGKF